MPEVMRRTPQEAVRKLNAFDKHVTKLQRDGISQIEFRSRLNVLRILSKDLGMPILELVEKLQPVSPLLQ